MLMVNSVMLSYLIDRSQRVVLDKFSSQPLRLSCGVPQDCFGTDVNFLSIFLHWRM